MKGYEVYIFTLCMIVFVTMTAFFGVLISLLIKMRLKILTGGLADEELRKKEKKLNKKKSTIAYVLFDVILPILSLAAVTTAFVFALVLKVNEKNTVGGVSVLKVVTTESMSRKHEKNDYLEKNNLNNQLQKFDLIVVSALPEEKDLKLYDIVVYEVEGFLIVHRIVEIKEPDLTHSERYFRFQGDASSTPDRYPVKYSQMKGIYTGKRVAYIGSFVVFLQSPAGYLCVLLVAFASVIYPFLDNKLTKIEKDRLIKMTNKG